MLWHCVVSKPYWTRAVTNKCWHYGQTQRTVNAISANSWCHSVVGQRYLGDQGGVRMSSEVPPWTYETLGCPCSSPCRWGTQPVCWMSLLACSVVGCAPVRWWLGIGGGKGGGCWRPSAGLQTQDAFPGYACDQSHSRLQQYRDTAGKEWGYV